MIIFFLSRDYLFTLIKKFQSTLFYLVIIISAYHKPSETVLPAVGVLLADEAWFVHKPDQVELQLDRSQLLYSEYLGPIPQEATQPTLTTKCPLHREAIILSPGTTFSHLLSWGARWKKCRAQCNSHLHIKGFPHPMLATLNVEWMAWTMETPTKIYFCDQEMAGEDADVTSIPLNPTKSWLARRRGGWLWKKEESNRKGDPEKIKGTTRERKWEKSSLISII